MPKLSIKAGSTSKLLRFFAQDSSSTTGAGLTGLAYNTASLTAYYIREGANASVQINLSTATLGTFTSGGFIVADGTNLPGVYELGIPDAAVAAGAKSVLVYIKGATNLAPVLIEIELTAVDNQSANGFISGMNGATAGASGGPLISGSNAGTTTFGALTVTGATTLTGNVAMSGTFAVAGTVTYNAFTVTNALTVSGATTLTGAVTASNASNSIAVNATKLAGNTLAATAGTITFAGGATVSTYAGGTVAAVTGLDPTKLDAVYAVRPNYAPVLDGMGLVNLAPAYDLAKTAAQAGDEMGLTSAVLTALFTDTDTTALVSAIIARVESDLDGSDLSVAAIAVAVRDEILNRVLAGNHDADGTPGKLLQALPGSGTVSTVAPLDATATQAAAAAAITAYGPLKPTTAGRTLDVGTDHKAEANASVSLSDQDITDIADGVTAGVGSDLAAIREKVNLLTGPVRYAGPVDVAAGFALRLVQGDAYDAGDRVPEWTFATADYPDLTGYTAAKLRLSDAGTYVAGSTAPAQVEADATVAIDGAEFTVSAPLTSTQTLLLRTPPPADGRPTHRYQLLVTTAAGKVVSLLVGDGHVTRRITPPT